MQFREIERLIKLIEDTSIEEVEISHWTTKIKISKKRAETPASAVPPPPTVSMFQPGMMAPPVPPPAAQEQPSDSTGLTKPVEKDSQRLEITAPMVGTFYRAPAPDASPYVEIGQVIEVGTVVCIIEAMKLMNEIESEVRGRIVDICVENAKPVQFGDVLFVLEPV
ncbi:MAG: acetyl-CoA carboxylase biotin carboxyl carrier protein [Gemmatimonadetes bacterium]|nr:MAG: acetyl-CoA carboxylase biotin carboxyl carrier protein [Gemmatimonadota bacterium]